MNKVQLALQVCNRSKVACLMSFAQAAQQLAQYAVDISPAGDVTIPPRDVLELTFFYRCEQCFPHLAEDSQLLLSTWPGVTLPGSNMHDRCNDNTHLLWINTAQEPVCSEANI